MSSKAWELSTGAPTACNGPRDPALLINITRSYTAVEEMPDFVANANKRSVDVLRVVRLPKSVGNKSNVVVLPVRTLSI